MKQNLMEYISKGALAGFALAFLVNSAPLPAPLQAMQQEVYASRNTAAAPTPVKLKNWGLFNTDKNSKTKSHIQAPDAWKIQEGSRKVVVAVIDTGIDPKHVNLRENLWIDPKSKDASVFGWNYVLNKPNPGDEHGHGTHVAGIIGAMTDSKAGISGVAHKVSIMPVKYYSEGNPGAVNLANTVKAIHYAIDNGAKVINYSGGGPEFSEDEYLAIRRAEEKGILFVAAAGNDHHNTDITEYAYYPSAYGLTNIISVAATDIKNDLLPSSNWGVKSVDVAAPGENIFSTLPGNKAGYMSGTSQATAFVSGVAALLLAENPNLKPQELRELIRASVDKVPQLNGKVGTGGRVNAYQALVALKNKRHQKNKPDLLAQTVGSLTELLTPASMTVSE